MKKLLALLILVIVFSSCSLGGLELSKRGSLFRNDRLDANHTFEKVLNAIQNKDVDALKSLFSNESLKQIDDFDATAHDLFEYFQGDFISYDDWGGAVAGDMVREGGKEWYTIQPTYDVKTSKQEYRFAFKEFTVNEFEPDKVGVWSIYVIKKENDTDPKCAYRGDGKWTPGINFEKVYKREDPKAQWP